MERMDGMSHKERPAYLKAKASEVAVEEKGYNGWTNYETWLVALWLDNERGTSDYWREQAAAHIEADKRNALTGLSSKIYDLSRQMKDEIEEGAPEVEGFWADLMNAALSEVNWYEIAQHYVNELDNG
jgi:hypothetical protein